MLINLRDIKPIFNKQPILSVMQKEKLSFNEFCEKYDLDSYFVDRFFNDCYCELAVVHLIEIAMALSISVKELFND